MNDERLKQAFDKMTPDGQSEKRMLAEIIRKGESYMDRKFTAEPVKPSRWAAIPAVMIILAMIAVSVFVAVRFDRNRNTANDPTQEHDTVPDMITEPDTHLESEVPPDYVDSPEPMTIPSYGEVPPYTVFPLPQTLDIENLENGTYSISIVSVTDSTYGREVEVELFVVDGYAAEDIYGLQEGDTIVIGSETVEIDDIAFLAAGNYGIMVYINGGFEEGGYSLIPSDGYNCEGDFIVNRFFDENLWNSVGIITLPVADNFILTDTLDSEYPYAEYTFEDLVYDESLREDGFSYINTTIVIEDGVATAIHHY